MYTIQQWRDNFKVLSKNCSREKDHEKSKTKKPIQLVGPISALSLCDFSNLEESATYFFGPIRVN